MFPTLNYPPTLRSRILEKFQWALAGARRDTFLGRLIGRRTSLSKFPYDIRSKNPNRVPFESQDIPVNRIVGSINRSGDFDNKFRPLRESFRERWVDVYIAHELNGGWEPIVVHRIGEDYYVEDGHHRVSVARELGMAYIQAAGWIYNNSKASRAEPGREGHKHQKHRCVHTAC